MKIRVLHVINTLKSGGAESNLYTLVRFSDKSHLEIHVAYSEGGVYEDLLKAQGVNLFKFSEKANKVKSLSSFMIIRKLAGYIRRNKIQIVHTHNYSAQVWGSVAGKLSGTKVFEHVHDPRYEESGFMASKGLPQTNQFNQAKWFAGLSDKIVVLTKNNLDYLRSRNISGEKIDMILNGIDLNIDKLDPAESLKRRLAIPADKKIVLTVMRLSIQKNAGFLIEIARQLKRRHPKVLLLVAGDGPEREALEEKARESGLKDMIQFLGFVSNIRELLTISDLFILPTLRELHSLSMIEAMSMRVPVLVSEGAGVNDYFLSHGENGFVLDPRRPEQWAQTISMLLENSELARRVGQAGRRLVEEKCNIRDTVKQIEKIYEELV